MRNKYSYTMFFHLLQGPKCSNSHIHSFTNIPSPVSGGGYENNYVLCDENDVIHDPFFQKSTLYTRETKVLRHL